MRQPNKNIQRRTFVKIRLPMRYMDICLSYKQAMYTNVYNEKQSGFGEKKLTDKWLKVTVV